jgi:hypothetical protein
MNPSVLNNSTISFDVGVVHRHSILVKYLVFEDRWLINIVPSSKDRWLIHIVPSSIQVIRPNKIRPQIQRAPEFFSITIKVINPYRFTRPAITLKNFLRIRTSDKYILDVTSSLCSILNFQASRVNEVVFIYFNVRIHDHDKPSLRFCDLLVQLMNLTKWPCFSVKDEVLKILRVIDVRPQYINWKSISREFFVTSYH